MIHNRLATILVVAAVASAALVVTSGADQRQDPSGTRRPNTKPAADTNNKSANSGYCGTQNDLARRVEVCADPVMTMLLGTLDKWPSNDSDVLKLCNSYSTAEKCIREAARRCGKGLQKTIISTLANSIQRTRKRECIAKNFPIILKTTKCLEKNVQLIRQMMANTTAHMHLVETHMKDLDEKTNAVCCMVQEIERNFKDTLNPKCPSETGFVVRLYRTVVEDANELICQRPKKCPEIFKPYPKPKSFTDENSIISVILRVVFSLGL